MYLCRGKPIQRLDNKHNYNKHLNIRHVYVLIYLLNINVEIGKNVQTKLVVFE